MEIYFCDFKHHKPYSKCSLAVYKTPEVKKMSVTATFPPLWTYKQHCIRGAIKKFSA